MYVCGELFCSWFLVFTNTDNILPDVLLPSAFLTHIRAKFRWGGFHWQLTLPSNLGLAATSSDRFEHHRAKTSRTAWDGRVQESFSPQAHLPSELGVSIKTRRGPFLFGVCVSGAGQPFGQCLHGWLCVNSHFLCNEA